MLSDVSDATFMKQQVLQTIFFLLETPQVIFFFECKK